MPISTGAHHIRFSKHQSQHTRMTNRPPLFCNIPQEIPLPPSDAGERPPPSADEIADAAKSLQTTKNRVAVYFKMMAQGPVGMQHKDRVNRMIAEFSKVWDVCWAMGRGEEARRAMMRALYVKISMHMDAAWDVVVDPLSDSEEFCNNVLQMNPVTAAGDLLRSFQIAITQLDSMIALEDDYAERDAAFLDMLYATKKSILTMQGHIKAGPGSTSHTGVQVESGMPDEPRAKVGPWFDPANVKLAEIMWPHLTQTPPFSIPLPLDRAELVMKRAVTMFTRNSSLADSDNIAKHFEKLSDSEICDVFNESIPTLLNSSPEMALHAMSCIEQLFHMERIRANPFFLRKCTSAYHRGNTITFKNTVKGNGGTFCLGPNLYDHTRFCGEDEIKCEVSKYNKLLSKISYEEIAQFITRLRACRALPQSTLKLPFVVVAKDSSGNPTTMTERHQENVYGFLRVCSTHDVHSSFCARALTGMCAHQGCEEIYVAMAMQMRLAGIPTTGSYLSIPHSLDSVQFISLDTIVQAFNSISKALKSTDLNPVREIFPDMDYAKLSRINHLPLWTLRDYGRLVAHYDSFHMPPDGWNVCIFTLGTSSQGVLSVSYVVNRVWMPMCEMHIVLDLTNTEVMVDVLDQTGEEIATMALQATLRLARQPSYVKELQSQLLLRTSCTGFDEHNTKLLEDAGLLPWNCEDCTRVRGWCRHCCRKRKNHIKKLTACLWCGVMHEPSCAYRKLMRCAECGTGYVCDKKCFHYAKYLHYAFCCTPKMREMMEIRCLARDR